MKRGTAIKKGALRSISEGLTEVKVKEGEWEDILIRMGDLLNDIRALDEIELSGVGPAFSFNPGGGRNEED